MEVEKLNDLIKLTTLNIDREERVHGENTKFFMELISVLYNTNS